MRSQKTIRKKATLSGIGVHTGNTVELVIHPAEINTGIRFVRSDLPDKPEVKADINNVVGFTRGTTIAENGAKVHTVEHILAAINAFGITNAILQLNSNEPPVDDGSSLTFVQVLQEAGIEEQDAVIDVFQPQEPIYVRDNDIILVVLPYDGFRISYTVSFTHPSLKAQYLSLDITRDSFISEIAPSRTFCFYREVEALMDQGLIKGGSLDNAVVIGDNAIFSKEKLRFHNEFVRHKILDLIGDTYLLGVPLSAHIIAVKSGHATNLKLTKALYDAYTKEKKQCELSSQ
ncbi:MAG: UDP-3-O-acyl-N-acetylglucosamine deacetylase [Candidatus Auribacterota bacterium]|jgi:UDP-3-O-[3-hydroxymyristoyl] N-acetylglucosamine deacetylase|nr:UDP-3-O-acyl-N-acetylglucosamine deacetylase [Candidatus Auribacterota bacterium]